MRIKKILLPLLIIIIGLGIGLGIGWMIKKETDFWTLLSPLGTRELEEKEKPLVKYEYQRLKERSPVSSEIVWEKEVSTNEDVTSYLFSYTSEGKKITGLANLPHKHFSISLSGPEIIKADIAVIVMLRGWVDPANYTPGVGTQRAGEVFAENGYLTFAPDYLGYGESDLPPDNVWEERLIRNINIMDLLASVKSMPGVDPERVGIWGHSNGGLSALTVLELSGEEYPTTLWAPVSQFFPYDVLYYTYEFDDKGRALRRSLAEFEQEYEADLYSFDEYLDWIRGVLQIHQGTADPHIPLFWTDSLVERLRLMGLGVEYFKYSGAGHNMEGSWDLVVQRDLEFFKEKL